jgi:hypothetical protein
VVNGIIDERLGSVNEMLDGSGVGGLLVVGSVRICSVYVVGSVRDIEKRNGTGCGRTASS